MTGYINDKDIFVRTLMGSKELESRDNALIPREARTLLILIDGQKSYAQVTELLEHRNLYKVGGVRQYMQMLVDLEYVVCKSAEAAFHEPLSQSTALSQQKADRRTASSTGLEQPNKQTEMVLVNKTKDQTIPSLAKYTDSLTQSKKINAGDSISANEGLRTIISTLVTKHAEPEQASIYNLRLVNCSDMRCIFELIQEMQRDASSEEFELALYLAALAFKKSKVSKSAQLTATQV